MSTITLPGFMDLHHLGGDEPRRRLARNQRRRDDDVDLFGLAGVHLALRLLEALAHDLGVAATARAFFLVFNLDEFTAQRHHLVGHFGTRVVGTHDRTQVGRGTDGGETRHTRAGHEDLGGRDLARRGYLTVEKTAEGVGCLDDGTVAADTRHGGQRIHLLCARECAWQAVHGQHRHLARGELLQEFGILCRPDEADQRRAGLHQGDLFGGGRTHLEDQVGTGPQLGGAARDCRTGGLIDLVTEIRSRTGIGLDADGETELDQFSTTSGTLATRFSPAKSSRGIPIVKDMATSARALNKSRTWINRGKPAIAAPGRRAMILQQGPRRPSGSGHIGKYGCRP
jgi:hypothetical protein